MSNEIEKTHCIIYWYRAGNALTSARGVHISVYPPGNAPSADRHVEYKEGTPMYERVTPMLRLLGSDPQIGERYILTAAEWEALSAEDNHG